MFLLGSAEFTRTSVVVDVKYMGMAEPRFALRSQGRSPEVHAGKRLHPRLSTWSQAKETKYQEKWQQQNSNDVEA
jgi:hypothetical protein